MYVRSVTRVLIAPALHVNMVLLLVHLISLGLLVYSVLFVYCELWLVLSVIYKYKEH